MKYTPKTHRFLTTFFTFGLLSGVGNATITLHTDRASFMSAINSSVNATLDFEDAVMGGSDFITVSSHSEEGLTINNLSNILSPAFGGGLYDTGNGNNANGNPGGTSTVSFSTNFFSAGFDLFTVQPSGDHAETTVTISLSSGDNFVVDTTGLNNGDDMFVGFISDAEISSFSITPTSGSGSARRWANTDNIVVSTTAVPEPSGVLSLGALLGLGLMLRTRC